MRVIYMGTPDFAINPLKSLIKSRHEVAAVFTQPDKPQGRKQEMVMPPVKRLALEEGTPVYQPDKIREQKWVELVREINPDVAVVAAFGQIIPKEILDAPRFGCINIHASLLPRYRGASPIQWSILNGDDETGITIMQMDEGIDTGDILLQKSLPIAADDTADTLFEKLSVLGGPVLLEALDKLETGSIKPKKQDEKDASYVSMIKKEMGLLCWKRDAKSLERQVRAFNSWPCAYTFLNGKQLKIWKSRVWPYEVGELSPGQVIIENDRLGVVTGKDLLEILELQLAGKKRMAASDFIKGYRNLQNAILGIEGDE